MPQQTDRQLNKPVIFLAFANDKQGSGERFLRNLTIERNGIRDALRNVEEQGLCEVIVEPDVTIARIFDIFQNKRYQDRIAIFHYGGHADSYELLLESAAGEHSTAHSEGLVSLLAKQKGLQLVFINGCCSREQSRDLIAAGVPAVVGTSQTIDDEIATSLSGRFYRGLAAGLSIDRAWNEAIDQVKVEKGTGNTRALHWKGKVEATDELPWKMYYREGSEAVKEWNLPAAANQPLFGLPLPESCYRSLPRAPFLWLDDFTKEDAALFFGRGSEIRRLHTQLTTSMQPLVLFYGKAGVGKSSLLQAGLIPRIENAFMVKHLRQNPERGLVDTLMQGLQEIGEQLDLPRIERIEDKDLQAKIDQLHRAISAADGFAREVLANEMQRLTRSGNQSLPLSAYWHQIEEKAGRPLLLILDQAKFFGSIQDFVDTLQSIFAAADSLPKGKLVLSYREEYHRTIHEALSGAGIPFTESFLPPLRWDGIVEAIEGVTIHPATRDHYHLDIERGSGKNLPEVIADDLLEGDESPVAPVLQVVLTTLWKEAYATNPKAPRFTVKQYQELKHNGTIMRGFFKVQLGRLHTWRRESVASGLILDVLFRHTTSLGTAASISREQLYDIYSGREELINDIIAQCQDCYLLVDDHLRGTSLAHNFLAPVVVGEFGVSVKPGQQAARLLNSKIDEFRADAKGIWLNDADLDIVESGKNGMRKFDADEERLLQISREQKAKREKERKRNRTIRNVLGAAIALFAILAGWKWWESERHFRQSKANQLAFIAKEVAGSDNTVALRIAGEAFMMQESEPPPTVAQTLSDVFHSQDQIPFYAASFPHAKHVNTAVFSPDGERVLTASEDGFAIVWAAQGNMIRSFDHKGYWVIAADFSPNGKQVLTAANDGMIRLWEMEGKLIDTAKGSDLSLFSTDGVRIARYRRDEDQEFQNLLDSLKQHSDGAEIIPSSNRQRALLINLNGNVILYDRSGTIIAHLDGVTANAAAFSADGKQFLTITIEGDSLSRINIWNDAGRLINHVSCKSWVVQASFSPNGKRILTASKDRTAKLWDLSGRFVHRLPKQGAVNSALFSPDATQCLTASYDGMLRLFDESGRQIDSLSHRGSVNVAVFSPDGNRVLTCSEDGTARIWIREEGRTILLEHGEEVRTAAFSADGSRILTLSLGGHTLLWTVDGTLIDTIAARTEVLAAIFSPSGRNMFTISTDSSATLWNENGKPIRVFTYRSALIGAAFSPDGNRILASAADSSVVLWKLNGSEVLGPLHHDEPVRLVAFSPDGKRFLTAGNVVKVWNESGVVLDSMTHRGNVTSAAFSSDGEKILTASLDKTAKLWSIGRGLMANYGSHTFTVNSANFSSDGKRIITASDDGFAMIWLTPRAIDEWLKTAPVYRLTRNEEEVYSIAR